jgi:hypothetical protein
MKIFISHATEDKDKVARPLAKALQKLGYDIWYDEYSLKLGDSLTAEIDRGLIECDYGVVIFSKSFFSKKWALNLADKGFIPTRLHSTFLN